MSLEACVIAAGLASLLNTGCLALCHLLQAAVPCTLCAVSKASMVIRALSMSTAEQPRLWPCDRQTFAIPVQV